jgi:two-component system, sensor histidine kinase PdtaS
VDADRITLHTPPDEVVLSIDTAVPCGLILSELLSSCLKHAFPGGQGGEITVTLTQDAERITLSVRDNGCGFPVHLDFRNTKSLGLQLVRALAEQLNGTMALKRTGGTAFTLTFPHPGEYGR